VRGLADGGVVHVQVAADGPDDHFAGVQADADGDRHSRGAADVLGVALDRLLHPERGVARAHRVVLVRDRSTEQGHDAVAHDLVDRSLVAMDGLHHPFEHGVEELARLFGIAIGEQLHRALEVGEQHGDLLALAFEGALQGEDLLGEVLWSVALRGREARGRGGFRRQSSRVGAVGAELSRWGELTSAVYTCPCQGRGALLAELRANLVLVLAALTFHCAPRPPSGFSVRLA